jgi:hypothetical protein
MSDYSDYGALAGNQIIINSGSTTILGDAGSTNGLSGTATLIVTGETLSGSDVSGPIANVSDGYNSLINATPTATYSDADIGGMIFTPGYHQFTNASLTFGAVASNNIITLNGNGSYIFQIINGDFTISTVLASVSIVLTNGAVPTEIYWLVNGSMHLRSQNGNITTFSGYIFAYYDIEFGSNSTNIGTCAAINGNITLNSNKIISSTVQQPRDTVTTNYINIASSLADNEAITINAVNQYGGIAINAGYGGILTNTTNSISFNAGAASNFTASNGNLVFTASAGLLNLDAASGINIGNLLTTTPIYIGTSSYAKTIGIGNEASSSTLNLYAGTGGLNANIANGGSISLNSTGANSNFTLNSNADNQDLILALVGSHDSSIVLTSQGTGADSINLNSAGGILSSCTGQYSVSTSNTASNAINYYSAGGFDVNTAGTINLATANNVGGAITLDAAYNNGGITLSAGSQGIAINATGTGLVGLGIWSGGDILVGTSAIARNVIIGNNTGSTMLVHRWGTNGHIINQTTGTLLADTDATFTISQLLLCIFYGTPTANRTLTLPTAAFAVAGVNYVQVNDAFDFTIINQSSNVNSANYVLATDTGGSMVGNNVVYATTNVSSTYFTSGSATFRLQFTNVTSGSEAYIVYRLV